MSYYGNEYDYEYARQSELEREYEYERALRADRKYYEQVHRNEVDNHRADMRRREEYAHKYTKAAWMEEQRDRVAKINPDCFYRGGDRFHNHLNDELEDAYRLGMAYNPEPSRRPRSSSPRRAAPARRNASATRSGYPPFNKTASRYDPASRDESGARGRYPPLYKPASRHDPASVHDTALPIAYYESSSESDSSSSSEEDLTKYNDDYSKGCKGTCYMPLNGASKPPEKPFIEARNHFKGRCTMKKNFTDEKQYTDYNQYWEDEAMAIATDPKNLNWGDALGDWKNEYTEYGEDWEKEATEKAMKSKGDEDWDKGTDVWDGEEEN
ncbi:uncharacterized protein LY89DRAFT_667899 [Mollisia scopiformis]|uniref:Uncharacterized protein n=1 Tax=Mollisia scopiformis TaxID=149040 RepID=A0A194XGE5_MOLSC|nr:uncharacterized protein LY89DRAFT_667899 [Mollisia scopiformis]KUJ18847.1 hypothetical protein LY89DRAFT_667899 [Mollisia scopiformis]